MAVPKRVTITKIAKKLAKRTRMNHEDLRFILHLYCQELQKAVLEGEPIYIAEIGTVYTARELQVVRNRETGIISKLQNYPKIRFRAAKSLKENFRKIVVGRWVRENKSAK